MEFVFAAEVVLFNVDLESSGGLIVVGKAPNRFLAMLSRLTIIILTI